MRHVCKNNDAQAHKAPLRPKEIITPLKAPNLANAGAKHSNLWALRASMKHSTPGMMEKLSSKLNGYGVFFLFTYPTKKLCSILDNGEIVDRMAYKRVKAIQGGQLQSQDVMGKCATIVSEFIMPVARKELQIGFQAYESSQVNFGASLAFLFRMFLLKQPPYLMYTWQPFELGQNTKSSLKILYRKDKSSWARAFKECSKYNMTLPSLENQESTTQLAAQILHFYTFPIFAIFVGLVQRVSGRAFLIDNKADHM